MGPCWDALALLVLLVSYCACVAEGYVVNNILDITPNAITCWTCPNKTDNTACNDWAPDQQCLSSYSVCQTIHRIDKKTGKSLFISKRCALPGECGVDILGCHDTHISGTQDCISCCNYPLCNEYAPANDTTAALYSRLETSSTTRLHFATIWIILSILTSSSFCTLYIRR